MISHLAEPRDTSFIGRKETYLIKGDLSNSMLCLSHSSYLRYTHTLKKNNMMVPINMKKKSYKKKR